MISRRIVAVISFGIVATASISSAQVDPAVGPDPGPVTKPEQAAAITLSDDPEVPVLAAQQVRISPLDDPEEQEPEIFRWRVFGDGRLEISPYPGKAESHQSQLEPIALQQLFHSLDQLYDLPAHQTTIPPDPDRSFVTVQVDRYVSSDGSVAMDYLNAVQHRNLKPFFEELHALRQWIVLSDPSDPIWFSGNPWPSICRPIYRDQHGLQGPETIWCRFLRERSESVEGPFDDPESRELVREKLRRRLRNLPRGLPLSSSNGPR